MSIAFGGTQFGDGACAVTTFAGQRVRLCPHVIERYHERVKPHLTLPQARQDLVRLITVAGSQLPTAPIWVANAADHESEYIGLGPDVVIAISRRGRSLLAITCLTPLPRKGSAKRRRKHGSLVPAPAAA